RSFKISIYRLKMVVEQILIDFSCINRSNLIIDKNHFNSRFSRKNLLEIVRSEEHTSELQSRENLVCRLLLEKKKKKTICIEPPTDILGRYLLNEKETFIINPLILYAQPPHLNGLET